MVHQRIVCAFLGTLLLQQFSVAAMQIYGSCCGALSLALGSSKVVFPNTTSYEESATTYFAQQEGELSPYCYVKPTCSDEVSIAIKVLADLNIGQMLCPFAVRGGGHHTVIGIANIHNGITIDLGNMNQTTINADKTIAYVGSGARWGSVYSTVVSEGLAVLGGREADIGVGGFITGGGISYFGAAYGFGCDMVENFEVVLASSQIVNANVEENSDLFAALKGGSNNFGVVTRFDLKTFSLGQYWGGQIFYLGIETPQILDAFTAYTTNPNFDNKSALIVTAVYSSTEGFITTGDFSYTEAIEDPQVFVNFTSEIPYLESTVRISNLSDFAVSLGAYQTDDLRETSITATVRPVGSLIQAIYGLWNATVPSVASVPGILYSFTFQPLPLHMLDAGALNGGNVLGLNSSSGPLVVLTLTVEYTSASFDTLVESTTRALFADIEALAERGGDLDPWIYLNYADSSQDVIPTYGTANVEKMKTVSERVDPFGFFQKVQPGGFKL